MRNVHFRLLSASQKRLKFFRPLFFNLSDIEGKEKDDGGIMESEFFFKISTPRILLMKQDAFLKRLLGIPSGAEVG